MALAAYEQDEDAAPRIDAPASVRGRWSPITRCIWERETKAWTTPESPNPKMSGHSVSQNMKNAIRRLSRRRPRICMRQGRLAYALANRSTALTNSLTLD